MIMITVILGENYGLLQLWRGRGGVRCHAHREHVPAGIPAQRAGGLPARVSLCAHAGPAPGAGRRPGRLRGGAAAGCRGGVQCLHLLGAAGAGAPPGGQPARLRCAAHAGRGRDALQPDGAGLLQVPRFQRGAPGALRQREPSAPPGISDGQRLAERVSFRAGGGAAHRGGRAGAGPAQVPGRQKDPGARAFFQEAGQAVHRPGGAGDHHPRRVRAHRRLR